MEKAGLNHKIVFLCAVYVWGVTFFSFLLFLAMILNYLELEVEDYCIYKEAGGSYILMAYETACDLDWVPLLKSASLIFLQTFLMWCVSVIPVLHIRAWICRKLSKNAAAAI